jgi:exopolysaccharide production protein ExoQ
MKKIIYSLEYGFAILTLILYSGAIFTLFNTGGGNEGDIEDVTPDNTSIKIIYLIIYFITFVLLTFRWKKSVYLASKNLYILLFTGLAGISIIWSSVPEITIARFIAILGTNLFSLYLASRYTFKQQILLLIQTYTIITVLSILVIVLLPKYGIMGGVHAGAWRGVFNHKNVLGKLIVINIMACFLQLISCPSKNTMTYFGLISSVILVIGSKSSSALVNLLITISILIVLTFWRWRYEIMIPASIGSMLLISIFSIWFNNNSALIFSNAGKDTNLTGRAELWPLALEMASKKSWLGYGYGAFWADPNGPAVNIWRTVAWNAPNAHNGFLDLFISVGLLGVFVFMLSFISTFFRAAIYLRYSKTPDGFWPLIFISYLILANLTETGLMTPNDLFTVLYITISYSVIINTNGKIKSLVYDRLS